MSIEKMLWTLAQSIIQRGMARPNATPAFTRYINGSALLPETGYCAADKETQSQCGIDGLRAAINHARTHAGIVGGWYFDGNLYFDSVRIYQSCVAAINAARENDQIGIYHLPRNEFIPIMEEGVNAVQWSKSRFAPSAC